MGIFFRGIKALREGNNHGELSHLYSQLNLLANTTQAVIIKLKNMYDELLQSLPSRYGEPTGQVAARKIESLEDQVVNNLRVISNEAELSFFKAVTEIEDKGPVSETERFELREIIDFLEELKTAIPDIEELEKAPDSKTKLTALEYILRTLTHLFEKYSEIEKHKDKLKKQVFENSFSELVQDIYDNSKYRSVTNIAARSHRIFVYYLNKKQLRALEKDAKKINAFQDPENKIIWRHPLRDHQIPEVDRSTGLEEPHINVTIKINGKRKNIHLLLKN